MKLNMRNLMILASAAFVLVSCGRNSIDERKRPDEFAVSRQAPLVVPPDFALAPPKPGSPRPLGQDSQQQALEAMFGPGVQLPPRSAIENRVLDATGADKVDPGIRSSVTQKPGTAPTTVDKGTFLREVMDAPAGTRNESLAKVTTGN